MICLSPHYPISHKNASTSEFDKVALTYNDGGLITAKARLSSSTSPYDADTNDTGNR